MVGRKFEFKRLMQTGEESFKKTTETIELQGVEHFLKLYQESYNSDVEFVKIIKRYLLDPINSKKRASMISLEHTSIKTYFEKNDSPIIFKFDSKAKHRVSEDDEPQPTLTLKDFLDMLTVGKPTIMQKAVFLCKWQRGLDTSTLVDRFNFQV